VNTLVTVHFESGSADVAVAGKPAFATYNYRDCGTQMRVVVAVQWDGNCRRVVMEMAKKVTVSFVDDLDGKTAAAEAVAFTLDGVAYEIDLSTKNAKKLRAALEPWIEAGRRVGGRRRSSIVGASRTATEPRESAAIRVWARNHGYQVARRGRIPADVVDAFRAAG
jgi:hypothetical protein